MEKITNLPSDKKGKCAIHKGLALQFLEINEKQINQNAVCNKCITSKQLKGDNLLSFDEILNCEDETVFLNWPVISQKNIIEEYQHILENGQDEKPPFLVIEDFFNMAENKIVEKLRDCKKKILANADKIYTSKQQLNEHYNKISEKDNLKKLSQDYFDGNDEALNEINQFINQNRAKSIENQQSLETVLQSFKVSQNLLQLEQPLMLQNQILVFIEEIFANLFIDIESDSSNKLYLTELQESHNDNTDQIIRLMNNPTNYCNPTFIKEFEDKLRKLSPFFSNLDFQQMILPNKTPLSFEINQDNWKQTFDQQISLLQCINSIKTLSSESIEKRTQLENAQNSFKELERLQTQLEKDVRKDIYLKEKQNNLDLIKYIIPSNNCSSSKENLKMDLQSNQLVLTQMGNIKEWSQVFCNQIIQPQKQYILRIQFSQKNFENFLYDLNYDITIGIIQKNKIHSSYLNTSLLSFSVKKDQLLHSNKGVPFYHSLQFMQSFIELEFVMCLQTKHFLLADFPQRKYLAGMSEEILSTLNLSEEYMLGIQFRELNNLYVTYFQEMC